MKRASALALFAILTLGGFTNISQAQSAAPPQAGDSAAAGTEGYGISRMQVFMQKRNGLAGGGRVDKPVWAADGKSLVYGLNDKRWSLDLATGKIAESSAEPTEAKRPPALPKRPAGTPVARAQ
ncbi:MAG: hypothetical protein ACKO9H_19980, partial [Planctomycetota bacterium]